MKDYFLCRNRISVCIATYNGEKYIKEQIRSILCQIGYNDEIIISDDNSIDKTLEIIKSFNDNRISIYVNHGRKGYSGNFENALHYANGEYIFLADQDDIWINGKVEICLKFLHDYDCVVSDAVIVNQDLQTLNESFFSMRKPYRSLFGNILKFGYIGCCFTFKRNVLKKALPFPQGHSHDNWIFLVAKTFYKTKILNEKLVLYRRHTSNASTGGFFSNNTVTYKIKYRLHFIYCLIKRYFNK